MYDINILLKILINIISCVDLDGVRTPLQNSYFFKLHYEITRNMPQIYLEISNNRRPPPPWNSFRDLRMGKLLYLLDLCTWSFKSF